MTHVFKKISTYLLGSRIVEEPVACQLNNAEFAERRNYLLENFASAVQQIKPISRGYAFTFEGDDETLNAVMKLICMERKCCRFLRFQLLISHEQHPVSLRVTGPRGTKKFLKDILGLSTL